MHHIRAGFSDQLQSTFLHLASQALGLCLALDVHHIVNYLHIHCLPQSQTNKLSNRESKEDLEKRLLWFFDDSTADFISVLLHPNLHHQIGKDGRFHIYSRVSLASCDRSAHLLFEFPASRSLDEITSAALHFAMVETLPDEEFKFSHLLAGFGEVFNRSILQGGLHHARRGA
jgi:hypothetical protein